MLIIISIAKTGIVLHSFKVFVVIVIIYPIINDVINKIISHIKLLLFFWKEKKQYNTNNIATINNNLNGMYIKLNKIIDTIIAIIHLDKIAKNFLYIFFLHINTIFMIL